MKQFYRFGILGLTIAFFLGWMLNCTGLESTPTPQSLITFNVSDVIASDWISADQWVSTSVFGLPARTCEINHKNLANRPIS